MSIASGKKQSIQENFKEEGRIISKRFRTSWRGCNERRSICY